MAVYAYLVDFDQDCVIYVNLESGNLYNIVAESQYGVLPVANIVQPLSALSL